VASIVKTGRGSGIYANLFWSLGFIFAADTMLAWCTLFVSCCSLMLLLLFGCHCCLMLVFICLQLAPCYLFMLVVFEANYCHST
jgi:hypothetical protein